jgi:hypothetical protein
VALAKHAAPRVTPVAMSITAAISACAASELHAQEEDEGELL